MCLQTFHGVEKTPLFYYNNQHQEKRFGGSKKGIRFSKKFFETHRKPHGYWVPVISVTKDKPVRFSYGFIFLYNLSPCLSRQTRGYCQKSVFKIFQEVVNILSFSRDRQVMLNMQADKILT